MNVVYVHTKKIHYRVEMTFSVVGEKKKIAKLEIC